MTRAPGRETPTTGRGLTPPEPGGQRRRDILLRATDSRWLGPAAFVAALVAPFLIATPYALNLMTSTAIFVMLTAGLNIVVGYCGLLDLGYAAFFAIGAYTSGILATRFDIPLLATVPAVVAAAVAAGVVIGTPTLRLRTDYLAIVTLGFGEIVRITAKNLEITGGPSGIFGIPSLGAFGFELDSPVSLYYTTLLAAALSVVAAARLGSSRLGRAWRFIREDEDAAEAIGIHTYRVKLAAYIAGALWGGIAGVFFAAHLSAIAPPSFKFLYSALILMAVVLGGMGSTPGIVVGAVFISLVPELTRGLGAYRYFIFGVLLVVIMIYRPRGLWPVRARERPTRGKEAP